MRENQQNEEIGRENDRCRLKKLSLFQSNFLAEIELKNFKPGYRDGLLICDYIIANRMTSSSHRRESRSDTGFPEVSQESRENLVRKRDLMLKIAPRVENEVT